MKNNRIAKLLLSNPQIDGNKKIVIKNKNDKYICTINHLLSNPNINVNQIYKLIFPSHKNKCSPLIFAIKNKNELVHKNIDVTLHVSHIKDGVKNIYNALCLATF